MANPNPEIVTLKFDTMAQGGEGLAREENGRVVFVPYAITGETARVEIVEAKRGFARGRILEILDASPDRITPRCPHFPPYPNNGKPVGEGLWCGGCQWQHMSYEAQLRFKTQIVRDQFTRVAKMPAAPILPILPSKKEWFYRNNMQFVVNQEGKLCLRASDSHTLVPIQVCYIMDEPLGEMFQTLELDPESFDGVTLRAGETTGDKFIILESEDPEVPEIETDEPVSMAFRSGDETVSILGRVGLEEKIGARTFQVTPDSFFQVNTSMAQTLVDLVTEYLAPRTTDVLLDAYGGVGLFGLTLANQVAKVIEIEENPYAVEDAQENSLDLTNVEILKGRVQELLPKIESAIDIIVVDPPRSGLERAALDAMVKKGPRVIAYVSCDTATLARDVARFVELGYQLVRVQPVDMFPQTHHIECVVELKRAEK